MLYSPKEKLFLGILFAAALVSLFFFIFFRTLAFPEHNIKFDITREEAAKKAEQFVRDQKYNPKDFKETTVFYIDDASKTYLEREVGVSETARLASNDVDVWHFTTRFFKPLEQEELTVSHLPNGRFAAYQLELKEEAKGAQLSKQQALDRAEQFLAGTAKTDLSQWTLVNSESKQQPNRTDHTFTWEKKGFKAKDATYRMEVQVYGDRIGMYYEYLKIPEAWVRAYSKETSNNDLAQTVAESIMFLVFGLGILFTFIKEYRKNNLRIASVKSIAIAAAIISILTALNSIPLTLSDYPTTISWEAFVISIVLISVLGGFFEGASILLIIAAGEAKFREMFPKKLSLEASLGSALQTKSVNQALFVGVFAGIIFFGYELLYYFLGKGIGFWSPAAINYSDIYSTYLPWIYPIFIGFLAAASEEGIFRLFGIPFLKKYLKSTWAAIIITAIVWGFLHSNYPQSPWFVRGIEISIIGIVLGWIFVRFGFIASFTAHFTFNALQTAISFYQSGSLYASISGTIVSLLPFILALGFLGVAWYKKGFAAEHMHDANEAIKTKPLPEKKAAELTGNKYLPFTQKRKVILIGLAMAGIVAALALYPTTSKEEIPTSVSRNEIMKAADEALAKRQTNLEGYLNVTTFTSEDISLEEKYILAEKDFETLNSVYPEKLSLGYWTVRYFKPLQKEEFIVEVLPSGKVNQIIHIIDEKAQGANLNTNQARAIAEQYLTQEKGYNLSDYSLIENKAEKKDKRTDHVFVYQEKNASIGEAEFQTEVQIQGNEIAGFDSYLKLPETWLREQSETTTFDFVVAAVLILFLIILVGFGYKTFFTFLRAKQLHFRSAYIVSGGVIIISIIATINSLAVFYGNYDTTIPMSTYVWQSILEIIVGLVFSFLMIAMFVVLLVALWKEHVGQILPKEPAERVAYIKDSIIAGYSLPFIAMGIASSLLYILFTRDWLTSLSTFQTFPPLDTFSPAIAVLGELPTILLAVAILGSILLLLRRYMKSWKRVFVILAAFAALLALPQNKTAEDIAVGIAENILIIAGILLLVVLVLRRNMLAYLFMLSITVLLSSGWILFMQPDFFFKANGIVLLVVAFFPVLLYLKPKTLLQIIRRLFS